MKLSSPLCKGLLIFSMLTASAPALDCLHGFWIFGHRHTYLSHKPEIGSPCHGYQVILEVKLEEANGENAAETYRKLEAKKGEMTVDFPEHFLLDEIKEGELFPVKGTLHEGNFEEKTLPHHPVLSKIPIRVVRKILFRKVEAETAGGVVHGFLFGAPDELYMVNRVDQNPDFDQIVQIQTEGADRLLKGMLAYPLPAHKYADGAKPEAFLKAGETGEFLDNGKPHSFRVLRKVELTMSADAFAASH